MNKSTLALALAVAVAVGVMAQQAGAAGFIEDSKATLGLRNFYINTDNRDGDTKAAKAQNKQEEWGQGFDLRFISGYTQGTVGFGIDAIGLLGVRLDSGGGTNGATSTSYGGTVFPKQVQRRSGGQLLQPGPDCQGQDLSDRAEAGYPAAKTAGYRDQRWSSAAANLPGWPDHFGEIKDLTLVGGQIEHVKGRNSSNNEELSIAGSNAHTAAGRDSNKFIYAGGDYKITKDLTAQYYYGNLEDSTSSTSWGWFTTGQSARVC
jgi:hypothetical protein